MLLLRSPFIFIPQRERVTGTGNRAIGVRCAKVNKRARVLPRLSLCAVLFITFGCGKHRQAWSLSCYRTRKNDNARTIQTQYGSFRVFLSNGFLNSEAAIFSAQNCDCFLAAGGFKVPADAISILMRTSCLKSEISRPI